MDPSLAALFGVLDEACSVEFFADGVPVDRRAEGSDCLGEERVLLLSEPFWSISTGQAWLITSPDKRFYEVDWRSTIYARR